MKVQEWCDQFETPRKAMESGYDYKDISTFARLLKAADAFYEKCAELGLDWCTTLEAGDYEAAKQEEGLE